MSNYIERNLLDKTPKRGSKVEQLLEARREETEKEARREEAREEKARKGEQEEIKPPPRGLPSGFGFRRSIN